MHPRLLAGPEALLGDAANTDGPLRAQADGLRAVAAPDVLGLGSGRSAGNQANGESGDNERDGAGDVGRHAPMMGPTVGLGNRAQMSSEEAAT